jgi:hypothetical protein
VQPEEDSVAFSVPQTISLSAETFGTIGSWPFVIAIEFEGRETPQSFVQVAV